MDWNAQRRYQCMCWLPVLLAPHVVSAAPHWIMILAWMLAGVVLLPVVVGAMPGDRDEMSLDTYRQGILQAHPEWPPDMRAAVLAGIICAGMPADMVRVAWGPPTRTSGTGGPGQRETWYYEGRPSARERLGGRGMNETGTGEWMVSFIDGRVVAWTD
jgi:hypothetical protein